MQKITALQIEMQFQEPQASGVIDLRNFDFRNVNMQETAVKGNFKRIADWAEMHNDNPQFYIDMSGSDVSGTDMRGFNLSNVVMTGIEAQGTVFVNANMSDAHVDQANVKNADFRQAELSHTKFYESDIAGANFSGANLKKVRGLGLRQGAGAIDRLGVVNTIRDAMLPENMEQYREPIQERIRQNREELPEYSADVIEYENSKKEDVDEKEDIVTKVVGEGFFSALRKKKKEKINS